MRFPSCTRQIEACCTSWLKSLKGHPIVGETVRLIIVLFLCSKNKYHRKMHNDKNPSHSDLKIQGAFRKYKLRWTCCALVGSHFVPWIENAAYEYYWCYWHLRNNVLGGGAFTQQDSNRLGAMRFIRSLQFDSYNTSLFWCWTIPLMGCVLLCGRYGTH